MKAIVTGAAGFIGSHIAEVLADHGHEVIGVDSFTHHYSSNLKRANADSVQKAGASFREVDLAESVSISKDVEAVIHCAAQPGISSDTPFSEYERNNIQATQNLLSMCCNQDEPPFFIYISTSSVYGLEATGTEDAEPKPASDYGVTKLAAEQLVLSRYRQGLIDAVSLRLFSVYGPRERPEKLFTKLIHAAETDQAFPLYEGSREHVRSFTYVGDVVQAIKKVFEVRDTLSGEIINIGNDQTNTTGEAIAAVENAVGKKIEMDMQPPRTGDQSKTAAQIDKARKLFNYNPNTSLEEGVKKQVEWFQKNNIHTLL